MKKEVFDSIIKRIYLIIFISTFVLMGSVVYAPEGIIIEDSSSSSTLTEQQQNTLNDLLALTSIDETTDLSLINHNWDALGETNRNRVMQNPLLANSIEERHVRNFIDSRGGTSERLKQLYENHRYRETFDTFFREPSNDPHRLQFLQTLSPNADINFNTDFLNNGVFERDYRGSPNIVIDDYEARLDQFHGDGISLDYGIGSTGTSGFIIGTEEGGTGTFTGNIGRVEVNENGELIVTSAEGDILTPIEDQPPDQDDPDQLDPTPDQPTPTPTPSPPVSIAPYTATAPRFPGDVRPPPNQDDIPSIRFNDRNTEIYFPPDTRYDITVRDNTYSAYPYQTPEFSQQYLDLIIQNAQQGDFTNLDLARLWLKSHGGNQDIIEQLANLRTQYPAHSTLFDDETLETIGNIALDQIITESQDNNFSTLESITPKVGHDLASALNDILNIIPVLTPQQFKELGDAYLSVLAEEYDEEKLNRIRQEITDDLALTGLNMIQPTAVNTAPGFRTYSNVVINSITDSYQASNPMTIKNNKRIIIIHSGDVTENSEMIVAEDATMFWNIQSMEDETIIARNAIKGKWIALKDENDDVFQVHLQSSNNRAIVHNDEAEVHMRSHGEDTIILDYLYDGNITRIEATSFDGDPRHIKEIYFGPLLPGNRRHHYVKGLSWVLYFKNTPELASGFDSSLIHEISAQRSVTNLTLKSRDSFYRYLPQDYIVSSSKYGDFKDKIVCFLNCESLDIENMVYVREDLVGLLSIGIMENIIINYEGNSREVFDPNFVTLIKEDHLDYFSNFNAMFNFDIAYSQEHDLLYRLNTEAKRDLSLTISLENQQELYYQSAKPASFTNLNDKIIYSEDDHEGYLELNFFSYIVNGRRKLVLNRFSYNNMVEINSHKNINIPVNTFVFIDSSIRYNVEKDLSISPNVYAIPIYFRSPDGVRQDFGEMISS